MDSKWIIPHMQPICNKIRRNIMAAKYVCSQLKDETLSDIISDIDVELTNLQAGYEQFKKTASSMQRELTLKNSKILSLQSSLDWTRKNLTNLPAAQSTPISPVARTETSSAVSTPVQPPQTLPSSTSGQPHLSKLAAKRKLFSEPDPFKDSDDALLADFVEVQEKKLKTDSNKTKLARKGKGKGRIQSKSTRSKRTQKPTMPQNKGITCTTSMSAQRTSRQREVTDKPVSPKKEVDVHASAEEPHFQSSPDSLQ